MNQTERHLLIIPGFASEISPAKLLQIREIAPGFTLHYTLKDSVTPELMASAEIIYGHPDPAHLIKAASLRWLHLPFAGIEPYGDLRMYANRTVTLTNARGVYGTTIAEHVLAMTLALLRRLPDIIIRQGKRQWLRQEESRELSGMTVLVVGMGDLGRNTAGRFRALGCRVLGIRRNFPERPPEVEEVYPLHQIKELLPVVDIVVCCLPATPQTNDLFDEEAFEAMRNDSLFINVGRGTVVDERALLKALSEGKLWGAAIDVAREEPLPPDNSLWMAPNLIISPHCSGLSPRMQERTFALFYDLLSRYAAGRSLYNRVDFFSGY